jgi:hypothetical protein
MKTKITIGILLTAVLTLTLVFTGVQFKTGGWIGLSIWEFITIEFAIIFFDQIRPGRPPRVPPPEEYAQLETAILGATHYFAATSTKPVELWEQPTFLRHVDLNTLKTITEYSKMLGLPTSIISSGAYDKDELVQELNDIHARTQEGIGVPYFYGVRYLVYPEKTYEKRRPFVEALLQKHLTYRMHCLPLTLEGIRTHMGGGVRSSFEDLSDRFRPPGRIRRAWYEIFGRNLKVPDFFIVGSVPSSGVNCHRRFL